MSKILKKADKNPLTGLDTSFNFEDLRITRSGENMEIVAKHIEYDLQGNPYKPDMALTVSLRDAEQPHMPPVGFNNIEGLSVENQQANKLVLDDLKSKILKLVEQSFSKLKFK